MFFVSARYANVWQIFQPKEKYCDLSVSTSNKKQDGTYENSQWPARVVGHAFEQVKKGNIKEGESYAIIKGQLSNVRYKNDAGEWKDNYRLLITEFAPAGSTESKSTSTGSSNSKSSSKPVDVSAADEETDPW